MTGNVLIGKHGKSGVWKMNRPERLKDWLEEPTEDDYEMYIYYLEKYCDELETYFTQCEQDSNEHIQRLENALDKACEEWEKEVVHCDFLLLNNKICDEKCGTCNLEKRKNYRKEWSMKDE